MRLAKRFVIWAVIMIVIVFCVNAVGTVINKFVFANIFMPSLIGYVSKSEGMIHPRYNDDPEAKTNGLELLYMRTLLDDERIESNGGIISAFIFMDLKVDQSIMFFDKEGMNAFSEGIFADVYEETDDSLDHFRHTIGLIPVRDFSKFDETKELFETLDKYPRTKLRLDSYTISDYIVTPVKITVLDLNDSEIESFEFASTGDVINSTDVYIYDANNSLQSEEIVHNSLYDKLKTAYLGKRYSDKAAEKLAGKISLDSDACVEKNGFGLGHYACKRYEIEDGKAMISIIDCRYEKSLLIYTIIFAIPVTLIVFLVGRRKKNDY